MPDRRSEPRRGIVVRVGLALAATGLTSAAVDRRALAGAVLDLPMAIGFGLALALLVMASLRRPPQIAAWLALGAMAVVHTLAAVELSGSPLIALAYAALALAATRTTAEHLRPLMVGAFALWTPVLWLVAPAARDDVSPVLWLAAALALALPVVAIADRRRVHPSERLRRAGYGVLSVAVASASVARTLTIGPSFTVNDVVALIAVGALAVLAFWRVRPALREAAATAVALFAFALLGLAYILGTSYGDDAVVAPHRAAELLVAGRQPYATFDMPEALARFGLDPALATHLEDGSVLRTYSYPALSFLVVTPFVWLGVEDVRGVVDIRWVYLGVVLVLAVVAMRRLRPAWRPMALATVVGSEVIVRQSILAGIDPSWALLVLGAWALRRSRWPSAILLGLAIADRQTAWFVAPFLIVAVAQQGGWREAGTRAGIAVVTGLLVNLPFLAAAPERAIGGILAPMLAPLQADGVGLMRLGVTDRYATLLPRVVYSGVSVAVLLGLLAVLWRRPRDLAGAALVFPFVPLWSAWRSLQNYFAFVAPFALVADDEIADEDRRPPTSPMRRSDTSVESVPRRERS